MIESEFVQIGTSLGDSTCQSVLETICRLAHEGEESTVWEIHQRIGLPLREAFAALRTLESAKFIDIVDHPSDPFGAKIRLAEYGFEALASRNAA